MFRLLACRIDGAAKARRTGGAALMRVKPARLARMHPSRMSKRFPGHPRIAAVLILVAAALVLLRPLCESWQGAPGWSAARVAQGSTSTHVAVHDGDSPGVACCVSGGMAVVAAVRDMDVDNGGASPSLAPPIVAVAFVVLSLGATFAFPRRALPRAPGPYHRRSSRILR
jgi:hypothetical protein